jgi:NTE family protein
VPVSDLHGELYSYFFFAGDFGQALIDLGRKDAQAWVDTEHSNGLWQVGALPAPKG